MGREFVFDKHDVFLFGRHSACPLQLPAEDDTASRYHFVLEVNPPEAQVRDLGSLNGTFVRGIKYGGRDPDEAPEAARERTFPVIHLRDGDEIQVGATRLRCRIELPPPSPGDKATRFAPRSQVADLGQASTGLLQRAQVPAAAAVSPGPIGELIQMIADEARAGGTPAAGGLNAYEIGPQLGEGGFGAVYLGTRRSDGVQVAIKVMLSRVAVSEEARRRFLREVEVTRGLRHPHIVTLLEHGTGGSAFYFILEFCRGGSVTDLMARRGGRLGIEEAGGIALQVLAALEHGHGRGIVHRDIKPGNILLTEREDGQAKLADYGLAKDFH